MAALAVFSNVGYHRAALDEVATRLDIAKPAHSYFRSREEITRRDAADFHDPAEGRDAIAEIDRRAATALTRLRKLIHICAADDDRFRHAFVRRPKGIVGGCASTGARRNATERPGFPPIYPAGGVAGGSIVDCDPKLAAFAIAGSRTGSVIGTGRSSTYSAEGSQISSRTF